MAVSPMVPLAGRISRAGGSDNSGGNGGGSAMRYGSGGRPVGRSGWCRWRRWMDVPECGLTTE